MNTTQKLKAARRQVGEIFAKEFCDIPIPIMSTIPIMSAGVAAILSGGDYSEIVAAMRTAVEAATA